MRVLYQTPPKLQPSKGATTKTLEDCSENGTFRSLGLHFTIRNENSYIGQWTTLERHLELGRHDIAHIPLCTRTGPGLHLRPVGVAWRPALLLRQISEHHAVRVPVRLSLFCETRICHPMVFQWWVSTLPFLYKQFNQVFHTVQLCFASQILKQPSRKDKKRTD